MAYYSAVYQAIRHQERVTKRTLVAKYIALKQYVGCRRIYCWKLAPIPQLNIFYGRRAGMKSVRSGDISSDIPPPNRQYSPSAAVLAKIKTCSFRPYYPDPDVTPEMSSRVRDAFLLRAAMRSQHSLSSTSADRKDSVCNEQLGCARYPRIIAAASSTCRIVDFREYQATKLIKKV